MTSCAPRLLRKIESLPDRQIYQVLDYIEFLEAKYAGEEVEPETTGLQRFAEKLEDGLRKRTVSPANIREAFQLIAAADRVLSNVSAKGQKFLQDLNDSGERSERESDDARPTGDGAAGPEREDGSSR